MTPATAGSHRTAGLDASHAVYPALRAAGVPLDGGFGRGAGHVTTGISGLEA